MKPILPGPFRALVALLLVVWLGGGPLPAAGVLTVVAGTGVAGSNGDGGPAARAQLNNPFGLARGPDGALWFADYAAQVVRRIGTDGVITTVIGNGRAAYTGDGGPAREASLNHPHEIRFDRAGNLFIADQGNNVIRRYDARTGLISTVAGNGRPGYAGDGGPAARAQLKSPISLQFDPAGDLFIADIGNQVIRRVDAQNGLITTLAGTGRAGDTPEGAPLAGTPLNGPRSLDCDRAGNLWLVTREGNQLLRLDLAAGRIWRAAGTGKPGFTGNGGPATAATLSGPKGLAIAPNGDVYLADTENHAIRRLDVSRGILEVVAGTGAAGAKLAADPRQTELTRPHGILVDTDGTVFISDSENHRILSLSPPEPTAAKFSDVK
jgi:streptogramin lyase